MVPLNPAFWSWFGRSVVRTPRGQPKIVYHGTRRSGREGAGFNIFRTEKINLTDPAESELGAHFGSLKQAEDRLIRLDQQYGVKGAHRIYAVYLSIQNPIRMDDPGVGGGWSPHYIAYQLMKHGDLPQESYYKMFTRERDGRIGIFSKKYTPAQAIRWLQSYGYDGIVYGNKIEGKKGTRGQYEDSYIILHSSQAKSAIGNRGTFDPNDPNILHGGYAPDMW